MIRVRPAVADDARGIAGIHVRTWQSAYRGHLPDRYLDGLEPSQREPMWTRAIAEHRPDTVTLVAYDAAMPERLLGFAATGPARDDRSTTGELYAIYIDPDAQAHGAGRALIVAAEGALRKAGFAVALLWVLESNEAAKGFYAHMGWTPDEETRVGEIFGQTVVERAYRKHLRSPETTVRSTGGSS